MKTIKKILAILSLFLLLIYVPIVVVLAALITFLTWWKRDINDILPWLNKIPEILSNFKEIFPRNILSTTNIISSKDISYVEKYFDEPEWWFFYMIRAKFNPENIEIMETKKIWKDQINIKFWFMSTLGGLGDPDPETWEIPNVSYRVRFQWTIVCKDIIEYKNTHNIKDLKDIRLQIKRQKKYPMRTIILSKDHLRDEKIIIICNKLSIKEKLFDMYSIDSDWKLRPFKNRNNI